MRIQSLWLLLAVAALAVVAPTASDAKPQATCKAMCQRLTDCKLSSYTKMCLDACKQYGYEASEEGRAQLLAFTRYTCKQIQSTVGATAGNQHQRASTPTPPTRGSSARPPAPSTPYEDDYDDDYDDASGPMASGQRSYQQAGGNDSAQTSSQGPGTSCSWVCRRLSECKLMSAQRCGEMCSIAASNGQPLRIDRESCAEIKKAFVTTKWTCFAEGSSGYAYGNGPWNYRTQSMQSTGRTRDEAALAAARDCNALMGVSTNLSNLDGAAVDSGDCKVTKCFPPGSPLY